MVIIFLKDFQLHSHPLFDKQQQVQLQNQFTIYLLNWNLVAKTQAGGSLQFLH